MARQERIVCECGGTLTRPIPKTCPHCGREIIAVRYRRLPRFLPLMLVALMFLALALYVWLLANWVQ